MKKYQKILVLSLMTLMVATGCKKNKPSTSSDSNTSFITASNGGTSVTSNNPVSNSSTTSVDVNNDAYNDSYSQAGHMYIHYFRKDATMDDYNKYGLWMWNIGAEGALFANPNNALSAYKSNVNTNGWMTTIGDNGIDEAGVCMDIDLNATHKSGKTGNPVSFKDAERIGYLLVKLESMDGSGHWVSDGGGDGFIDDISVNTRANGSIHVFLKSGSVREPQYVYSAKEEVNPIIGDTTGIYRSKVEINASKVINKTINTSNKFSTTGAVGYQIFIPTFADSNGDNFGDLRGVINKLDYLKSLNVDTLWLSPFLKCNSYHGYDTVDYYTIDSRFGTIEDMRELIAKAHSKGMKVIMDLVINHASDSSLWFKKAQKGEKGLTKDGKEFSYRDLFHFKLKGDTTGSGKKVENDPDYYPDGETNYFYYAKFASNMPEFNFDAQITRDMLLDVAYYWLGFGFDGYRVDAIKHIYMLDESTKNSSDQIIEDKTTLSYFDEQLNKMVSKEMDYSVNTTKNLNFWTEFSYRLKAMYPDAYLVGENFDGWDERISPYYGSFDSQFDFNEYYHNLEYLFLNKGCAKQLATDNEMKLNTYFAKYRKDAINATFTSNHDVNRAINHINEIADGNNATKNIKITGTEKEINRAKLHAAITILQPGISYIYYGDELGMSSNTTENDKSHNNSIDRYYRQGFKWANESERCTFSFNEGYTNAYDSYTQKINDNEAQAKDANSMLSFYKAMTSIKADSKFPNNGTYRANYDGISNTTLYSYTITPKQSGQYKYTILMNASEQYGHNNYPRPSGAEIVYKFNATDSNLSPYGIVVMRQAV